VASTLVVLVLIAVTFGALLGGFLIISFSIRREDRNLAGSLRFDAPSYSSRTARTMVGFSSSRCD
jgi:hypothetical protein